jgi:carbon monoxide dehydrogenase subunit G
MAIELQERYVVGAPVAAVWDFLVDPRRVVACVPGGELTAVLDERTFDGTIRVIVGPLTLAYGGRVRLADVDAAARRVRILGDAHERAGTDSARLTLESWLTPLPGGATEVVALARVDVAGRVVELGRGVLESLGHLVFQQFASCVRATVEAEQAPVLGGARAAAHPKAVRPEPLRAVPLVFRAVKAWVAGWFRARRDRSDFGGDRG